MKTPRPKNCANSATARKKRLPIEGRSRADEARKRLGADPEALALCRKITPLLKECALDRQRVVEILEQDDEDDSVAFCAKYRSVAESDHPYVSIEEITIAAGLTTRRLWELIQGTRLEQSQDAVKLLVADNRAAIMAKTLASAKDGDMKAVELLWKADGTLPKSNGISLILSQNNNSMPQLAAIPEEDDVQLGDMDTSLKDFQRVTSTPPQLEAPRQTASISVIDAEYEEVSHMENKNV